MLAEDKTNAKQTKGWKLRMTSSKKIFKSYANGGVSRL